MMMMMMMMMIVLCSDSLKEFKIVKKPPLYFLRWTEETQIPCLQGSLY
jgi:hypothetical protein